MISTHHTEFGTEVNHPRYRVLCSIPNMDERERSSRSVLWENVAALMRHHWGKENLQRLGREAKNLAGEPIGASGAARIKANSNVGVDMVDAIAKLFRLQAWQLLFPSLDPSNPPVQYMTAEEKALYDKFKILREDLINATGHNVIKEGAAPIGATPDRRLSNSRFGIHLRRRATDRE